MALPFGILIAIYVNEYAPRAIKSAVNLTLGLSQIVFLTPVGVLALLGTGTLLGGLGGWLARAGREP